jgi:hypothetical protein
VCFEVLLPRNPDKQCCRRHKIPILRDPNYCLGVEVHVSSSPSYGMSRNPTLNFGARLEPKAPHIATRAAKATSRRYSTATRNIDMLPSNEIMQSRHAELRGRSRGQANLKEDKQRTERVLRRSSRGECYGAVW